MKNNYLPLAMVGLMSGIVNAVLLIWVPLQLPLYGGPPIIEGVPFGLITGMYFIYAFPVTKKYWRLLAWTAVSELSYFFAVYATLYTAFSFGQITFFVFWSGGLVGALVVSVGYHFIFGKLKTYHHIMLAATGATTALVVALFYFPPNGGRIGDYSWSPMFFVVLYIAWQTLIALLLGKYGRTSQAVLAVTK